MTFVLVSTVYAVAIGEPSFGVVGPFAVGLSLFAMVFAGKATTTCCTVGCLYLSCQPLHDCLCSNVRSKRHQSKNNVQKWCTLMLPY